MLSLGIDTSNYTTSAALADTEGQILEDNRVLLSVKPGERGLRQSDALFQHWKNLPGVLDPILEKYRGEIGSVTVSVRPRPVEGSYMPVFTAGQAAARMTASALGVPLYECSHQEGHLAAAALGSGLDLSSPFLFAHLSGGTLEIVKVSRGSYEIAAEGSDISYGQLLDRCAVMAGFPFPGGRYVDALAMERLAALRGGAPGAGGGPAAGGSAASAGKNPFARIYKGGKLNLSGLENQFGKLLSEGKPLPELCFFLMERIAESFRELADGICSGTGVSQVLLCGGVASSAFLREYLSDRPYFYGRPELCSDNAAGCALIAGRMPWL